MPPFACNFLDTPRRRVARRWLATGLAVALLAMIGWREHLITQTDARQQSLNRLHAQAERLKRLTTASEHPPTTSPEAIAELNQIAAELTRPWEAPLGSLQRAAGSAIILDRIQPAPASRLFIIQGRSATPGEFLSFLQRLQTTPGWHQIRPVSNEPAGDTAGNSIRFELIGQWSGT